MPAMPNEPGADTLEDHLRRASRNFTARLDEDVALRLGQEIARELDRAHHDTPPRYPEIDPARIHMVEGKPRLDGGGQSGEPREALFELGALLQQMVTGLPPDVSWRLDGPPAAALSSLTRGALLASLTAARPEARFSSAKAAAEAIAFELAKPDTAEAPPWPLFRGDAARTGTARAPVPPTGMVAAWSVSTGPVVASPVLSGRLVFVPTQDGRLVVLDRASGRLVASVKVASGCESSPALHEGRVLVGTDDGELLAFDIATAKPVFSAKLGQMVRSSPLPVGDLVVVGVVDSKDAGAVVALDAAGKVVWRNKRGAVFSSAATDGERVFVAGDDKEIHALDAKKGKLLWKHAVGGRVRATPALHEGVAVVGDFDGRLVGVRLADGQRAWTRDLSQPIYSSACLHGGVAVVGCHDGFVRGFLVADGAPVFETPTRGPVVASPTAFGALAAVGSTDGDFYLFDAQGRVVSRTRLAEGGTQSSAAADAQGAVVGSARGVHAFGLGA